MMRSGFGLGEPHHSHDATPPPSSKEDCNSVPAASGALSLPGRVEVGEGVACRAFAGMLPAWGLSKSPLLPRDNSVFNCVD